MSKGLQLVLDMALIEYVSLRALNDEDDTERKRRPGFRLAVPQMSS